MFVALLSLYNAHAQRGARIAYIDTEYILENVKEYQTAQSQLNAKVGQWKTEVDRRYAELDNLKNQLNTERVLLTAELLKEREEDLQIIENDILDYQQKRFGPNGDLVIQKTQLIQPIQDQIFAAVQDIANAKKFDFIFDKSADVVMLYSADRYDISEQVLRTINRSAEREQIKNRKDRKAAEKEDNIVEVDSDKDERQRLIDERNAKRAEAIAKRKEELEAKKAARKKEVEEKKRKIQEAREKAKAEKAQKTEARKNQSSSIKKEAEKEPKSIDSTKENETKDTEQKKESNLSPKEVRAKALEEKKKRILAERKARLEAIKRKKDSIKNNKK
ncbi:MAG: OmpH family outer membrane protein [Flavobacteriaceae bacterium]